MDGKKGTISPDSCSTSTLEKGWFKEGDKDLPSQYFALKTNDVLFHEKSEYQDILIFENESFGKVMVLDGIINTTQLDECAYHEMMAFLPLHSHHNPKKVLIIGGGDGGVARECAKHPQVEEIVMACGFDSPKVTLHIADGLKFLETNPQTYDVIIADTTDDTDGPAALLFTERFYSCMKSRLNENGIICTQGQCPWLDMKSISKVFQFCRGLFPSVGYAAVTIPSYTTGYSGFIMCGIAEGVDFKQPVTILTEEQKLEMGLKFYDEGVHRGSFELPRFVKQKLNLT